MKKQATSDAKKRAANDVEKDETPKAAVAKAPKAIPDQRYELGSIATVKRGFLLAFVEFAKKKGSVNAEMLIAEFGGRQIDGHKIDATRVHRYISYCRNHGIFKPVKNGGAK
jgi:hypothetical protein